VGCLVLRFGFICLADGAGVILQTGGTQFVLPAGGEKLNQPETFFIRQRAHNSEKGIALSAGAIKIRRSFSLK
jgi:hypothetical protein